jgi:glycosyltransferase involved in cell wall biosynthesis
MNAPTISVAMSVYNGERFLAQAIESILSQSFTDFEFLILDDGSKDGTREIIEGFAARDPRIRPILRENRGLIASLNQLIGEARAELIARMDADDISKPERFARQITFLAENPECGVVGSWTEDIDEAGGRYHLDGADHPLDHEQFLEAVERGGSLLCHPSVIFRRDIVRSVGGYHAAFKHCEDMDLWLRLASVTRIANLPERLLRYRHYDEQISSRHATEQQIGAAISALAFKERQAGRPDPTEHLGKLPALEDMDALFGREGVSRWVRSKVAPSLLYSRTGLRDEGFDIILQHIREGGARDGMWRTVARLLRFGEPVRALTLATALATS